MDKADRAQINEEAAKRDAATAGNAASKAEKAHEEALKKVKELESKLIRVEASLKIWEESADS